MLLVTLTGTCGIAGFEELIASAEEFLPQLVAQFLGYHANGLPFLLQGNELVAGRAPVGAVLQGLGLLNECAFLLGILLETVFQSLEIFCLVGKEFVAGSTETLKDLHVHLLRSKSYGLPLLLNGDNLFCMALPVAATLILFGSDGFYFLAEGSLLLKVLLLAGTQILKVLLVTLVDHGAGGLETLPYLFTQFLAHRTHLAILLMQLLQLVEGTDDIFLISQFLGSLTQACLGLQIFLEVQLASLAIQFQQVVELLHIQLVVAPQLVGTLGWHSLDVAPLLLQGLEFLIGLAGFLGRCHHSLDLFYDSLLLLQVFHLLGLLLTEQLLAALLNDTHLSFENFFVLIGGDLVSFWIASTVNIFLQLCLALSNMQFVEYSLQVFHFFLLRSVFAVSYFLYTFKHFLLGGIDLALFSRRCVVVGCFYCGLFDLHFLILLFEDVFLRVHHLTF